jgi:molybdopterin/thiamine biosynthesis adenylyltransferase
LKIDPDKSRTDGLRVCVGQETVDKLAYTKLFMVGAGAIGCELLKNYAMLGVGTGKATMY